MECRELIALALEAHAAADPESTGPLRREISEHTEACPACREELARVEETWSRLGEDPDLPMTPQFRRRTLALIDDEMLRARIREFRPARRFPRAMLQAAALLLAVAGGFWVARASAPKSRPDRTASGSPAVSPAALESAGSLSNVSYRPADPQGRIGVSFDVTSRQTVLGKPEDPRMARLFAYLVSRGAQTSGEKSRAIELVSTHYGSEKTPASPDVVRALTATLRKDGNPGVRKKAADALAGFQMTPEIRTAFLDALRNDRNPGVRLVAVDALAAAAKDSPDAKTIESLREKAFDPTENGFVRAKAASALKAIEF
ncbi:MAG: HEAT repeat domain-containing protein [Acidobacteriota bacterium]